MERAKSEGAADAVESGIETTAAIDFKTDLLKECVDDKESVASENVPSAETTPFIEADFQTNLIENKPALSEGNNSDHSQGNNDSPQEVVHNAHD